MMNRREELEIDLLQLCRELIKKLPLILLAAVILAVAAFGGVVLTNDDTVSYKAEASIYLSREAQENEALAPLYLNSSTAKAIADMSIHVIKTQGTLEAVAADSGLSYDAGALSSMISAAQINALSAVKVTVTSPVSGEAEIIAESVVDVWPERFALMAGDEAVRISEASVSQEKEVSSARNPVKMALIGAVAGAFLAACAIVFKVIFSEPVIYKASDLAVLYPELPLLADAGNKACGKEEFKYAAAKLLNMEGSGDKGVAIAYTAVKHAGLSALELALATAEFGRRVLLVDAEMYGRALTAKAGLETKAGFAECVSENLELGAAACRYENFDMLPAGRAVENVAALMADKNVEKLINDAKSKYDYVIVNLPAVGLKADALPVAGCADGLILGLEENKCTVKETDRCVERLMRTGTKLLGFIAG